VIVYNEQDPSRYESAVAYWFKDGNGRVHEHVGPSRRDPVGVIDEPGDEVSAGDGEEAATTGEDDRFVGLR
jgi:hypothetical protein